MPIVAIRNGGKLHQETVKPFFEKPGARINRTMDRLERQSKERNAYVLRTCENNRGIIIRLDRQRGE